MSLGFGLNFLDVSTEGLPFRIIVDGVEYERVVFSFHFLDMLISSQPLYMRAK